MPNDFVPNHVGNQNSLGDVFERVADHPLEVVMTATHPAAYLKALPGTKVVGSQVEVAEIRGEEHQVGREDVLGSAFPIRKKKFRIHRKNV